MGERPRCKGGQQAILGLEVLDAEANPDRIKVRCPECGRRVGSYFHHRRGVRVTEGHYLAPVPASTEKAPKREAKVANAAAKKVENVELAGKGEIGGETTTVTRHAPAAREELNGAPGEREFVTAKGLRYAIKYAGGAIWAVVEGQHRRLDPVGEEGIFMFRHPRGRDVAGRIVKAR